MINLVHLSGYDSDKDCIELFMDMCNWFTEKNLTELENRIPESYVMESLYRTGWVLDPDQSIIGKRYDRASDLLN